MNILNCYNGGSPHQDTSNHKIQKMVVNSVIAVATTFFIAKYLFHHQEKGSIREPYENFFALGCASIISVYCWNIISDYGSKIIETHTQDVDLLNRMDNERDLTRSEIFQFHNTAID